jgi:hypothetical protein
MKLQSQRGAAAFLFSGDGRVKIVKLVLTKFILCDISISVDKDEFV